MKTLKNPIVYTATSCFRNWWISLCTRWVLFIMENQKEIWKDVIGYEGYYQVSNFGRIKSIDRTMRTGYNIRHEPIYKFIKGTIRKLQIHKSGRINVVLRRDGNHKSFYVHRLVAMAFIPNPENKKEVNHINGIVDDNRPCQLEWVTPKENIRHSFDVLGRIATHGNKHGMSKLTENQVYEIKLRYSNGERIRDIVKLFDASFQTIHGIVKNKVWKHVKI